MCVKSKIGLLLLVLVLLSAPLFAWSPKLVGNDSRDLTIHNQEVMIDKQASQILELQVVIELKEKEIASLQDSLMTLESELSLLGTDSTVLLKQIADLETILAEAENSLQTVENEQETLEIQLDESKTELIESAVLVETATEIVSTEPNPFGGFAGAGAIYSLDGSLDAEVYAGLSYGMFGVYAGIQADVDADMYLPSQWSYKAGVQLNF